MNISRTLMLVTRTKERQDMVGISGDKSIDKPL